jgi:hypothetical protein
LPVIAGRLHDFRGGNQVVLGIDGHRHVVAHGHLLHPAAVGVRQRDFGLGGGLHLRQQFVIPALAFLEHGDLFLQRGAAGGGGHTFGRGVLPVQFAQVFVDAGFHFLHQAPELFLGVVAARVVDRFELAAVDGHQFGAEQVELAAEEVEVFEEGFEGAAVVLAEVGDGLEVRAQTAQQPDHFEVAGGLGFEAAAGADAVEVAVEVEFEPVGGVIGRPAGGGGLGVGEPQGGEVQALDVGVKEAGRGVGGDVIVQAGGQELDWGSVGAALVAHHVRWLSYGSRRPLPGSKTGSVFTRSVTPAATS